MESVDARIMLLAIAVFVVFTLGRKWQRTADIWNGWRATVASIPGKRKASWAAVRATIKSLLWVALIVGVVAALLRNM